jgi:hypothetical protein
MSLVSVTRFRLRSIRFIPFFVLAFWTLTVWRDEHAMRAYGASGAHRKARPHLADWADEASVGHRRQPGSNLPEWPEAVRRLREAGRPLTLRHPVPNHLAQRFVKPQMAYGLRL